MKRIKSIVFLILMSLVFSNEVFSQTEYQTYTYPSGQILSEGTLRDGKPDGLWKTYYESGQLKSIGRRTNFLLDSTWVFFSEAGDTTLIVNYVKDLKNGPRFTYGKEDILMEPYVNDVKQGEGRRYDKKWHLIQNITYKDGFEEGISPVFDTTGLLREIITYRKGFGFYKEYDEKGNLKKITKYVNDVEQILEGDQKPLIVKHEYYPNGKVKREASFRDGKREGVWREFDEEGNVINSQTYKKGALVGEGIVGTDGKRRGEYKEFYSDSTLRAEGLFIDGERSGEWKFYYQNGQIQEVGSYNEGQPDGFWNLYYSSTKVNPMDLTKNMMLKAMSSFREPISTV